MVKYLFTNVDYLLFYKKNIGCFKFSLPNLLLNYGIAQDGTC